MKDNVMILGQNAFYDLNSYKTQLNNNVLVVGKSQTKEKEIDV